MKFYNILIVNYTLDTPDKVAIYTYNTLAEAEKAFYGYMSTYINGENVESVNVELKNNLGGTYKNDTWTAPTPVEE